MDTLAEIIEAAITKLRQEAIEDPSRLAHTQRAIDDLHAVYDRYSQPRAPMRRPVYHRDKYGFEIP